MTLTAPAPPAVELESAGLLARLVANLRTNPKRELWIAWWTTVVFYQLFSLVFFVLTRTQPPTDPDWSSARVARWFLDYRTGLLVGFGIMFLVTGLVAFQNALNAYSMWRMSVSRAYGYAYLVLISLSALPGMLLMCVALTVGAMRPDRDPEILHWLYDLGYLSYVGTMGVFLIASIVWMVAILIDRNGVLPKWFAYLNLCNALTEVIVSPAWVFRRGPFAWNGVIAWWIDMIVFGIYAGASFLVLRTMIRRDDLADGPLPELAS